MSEVKQATVGRIVHFFPNGADAIAANNNAEVVPAIVVQAFSSRLNLSVFPMNPDAPQVLRYSVPHKSDLGGVDGAGNPVGAYWDWPEIK